MFLVDITKLKQKASHEKSVSFPLKTPSFLILFFSEITPVPHFNVSFQRSSAHLQRYIYTYIYIYTHIIFSHSSCFT